jgi:hypothetical protein
MGMIIPKQRKKERDQITIQLDRDVLQVWRITADIWNRAANA